MIRFVLILNRHGKCRLSKYYTDITESEQKRTEKEVHAIISQRNDKFTNFVEYGTHKLVYRRYCGVFFIMCVDITDNELMYLEVLHLFVETLDMFFKEMHNKDVRELDLVFNFHQVYAVLDEFILAGEVQETSKATIVSKLKHLEKDGKPPKAIPMGRM
eukprot:TRINITY_DN782023_c0_g1_i1.p1 TRINITY_DN782023_c0_g1~~TRINITY_DN782023_c0_g1_i1.p1  ORF type:complete len:159 (-),score=27.30 TRINITY_DN782023_c0_g1_i1:146-622(-)